MKTRLLFLGPPGAGKGTQAERLCEANGMKHLSTGDLLRAEVAAGTGLGQEAEAVMNRGELVSDSLVLAIVENQMKAFSGGGWLLDGRWLRYPASAGAGWRIRTRILSGPYQRSVGSRMRRSLNSLRLDLLGPCAFR